MKRVSLFITVMFLCLTGCSGNFSTPEITTTQEQILQYKQISQDEAKEMMAKDDGHIIVDVRRQDEYDAGHIPGAILIPNESIDTSRPKELPDLDQIILVYCRSGRRSKEASEKLAKLGYTKIYEFGGIITWTGETTRKDQ
jgi:rhodanese-related sulfurtransferase